jgi:hypothetical protein
MTVTGKDAKDSVRLLLDLGDGRQELVLDSLEVVANTEGHVVVLFSNDHGQKVRATLPKAKLRQMASFKMLW